ncbi:MAG: EAL domain-containing protein [Chthoniobacterales bacterium]
MGVRSVLGNFGGDKFYILMHRFDSKEELQGFQGRIRECFSKPFPLRDLRIMVEVSIGGVELNNAKTTPLDLMLQIDEAIRLLKSGKHQGFCMVDDKIIASMQKRIELDQVMTDAIEHQRMFLLYQPIVDIETGILAGAEALLRCRREDGSVMAASDFFESLERTNKMASVDAWSFAYFNRDQIKIAQPLLKQKGFRISFNISPGLLSTLDYGQLLLDQMKSSGMSPSSLSLEILERDLLLSNGDVAANLNLLLKAGVRIAVDDFGTGYSNLMRLATQPIDTVKIDKSYLEGIVPGDPRRNALLASLVGIAKNLGYIIIAEGIEAQAQADHLRDLGCHLMQGYLYGKPMSLEELLTFVGTPMTPIIAPE